jgi:multiple sugar transport system permease protein
MGENELLKIAWKKKGKILRYLIGIMVAVFWLIPFIGVLMASLRPLSEIIHGWWHFKDMTISFTNYIKAWSWPGAPVGDALLNSLIVTVPATLAVALLGLLTAYPIVRFRFIGRKFYFFCLILTMAAPPELIIISNYRTLQAAGLLDTFLGLIFVHVAWGMGWTTLFLRNFLFSVPLELEESARVDGANRWQIFYRIILPITAPALASVGVVQFVWTWNSLLFPLVFLRSPGKFMVTQVIPIIKGRIMVNWGAVSAASIIAMAIPVILFFVLQRYYKEGLTGGYSVG